MVLGIILSGSTSLASFLFTFSVYRGDAFAASFLAIHTQIDVPSFPPNSNFLKLVFSTPGSPWDAGVIVISFV